ncbi:hypothetical protein [Hymenobacter aerophilus]|uniref:hypothetical protein n=1 Tax=Hymenobacter aerophilus TaxID=119644 RepID=UPI0003675A2F|nr:hypothetical protein [Hymenobacter aerophilus]
MKILLPVLLALAGSAASAQTPAPPDPTIPRLIAERQQLVSQYEAANGQRNAFLANKPSKKDLQEVVDALKGIIRKDTELIQAVQAATLRQTAAVVAENQQVKQQVTVAQTDRSSTQQRFHDLENQVLNLQERERQQARKMRDLQATADDATGARTGREVLAAALALLAAGLLAYVLKLRGQLSARPVRRK